MAFTSRVVPWAIALATLTSTVLSTDMTYCASLNTASTSANSSIFQSDGLCTQFCSDFAFAIVQDSNCWCSNYVPDSDDQVDTGECDTQCPGYPSDTCGGDGLYGYMQLDVNPSGTSGGSTPSSTTQEPTTATVQDTVTIATTVKPSTTSESSESSDTTTAKATTSVVTTPTVSVATVTAGGTISLQTVTVMPTVTADPSSTAETDASTSDMSSSSHGLSTGAAVGVAVGVLGALVLIGAVAVFLWLRRKKQRQEQEMMDSPHGSVRGSSAGMIGTPTTTMASVWDGGEGMSMGRRSSRLMPHDPRMDPYGSNIYGRFDNKSHESINTLQDNHDYSRKVLRTTNPDPDE
ncbi:hypothetical protein F5Y15DRAFT_372430 [Xylariaceae sp. FL0016]|nr:hypothetical protein F5Y15DRAFT_372430 [Xylariaceae sp. FL0016]